MKNVIYINCWVDPWIKVAKLLQNECDLNPVWWIGYSRQDHSDSLVPSAFPEITFQDEVAAWKGQFPQEIEEKSYYCYLDVDFLRRHAHQELQIIKMMDRVDPDRYSFNFMERQRHYRNLLKKWSAVIDLKKVDMVISTEIPHRIYDYALFWLCQERGIPYVMMNHTPFAGRYLTLKNDFFSIGNRFVSDWHKFESMSDIASTLPNDVKEYFEKVKNDYQTAAPQWMRDKRNVVKYTSVPQRAYSYLKRVFLGKSNLFSLFNHKPIKELGELSAAKNRLMKHEESYFTSLERIKHNHKKEQYLKDLLDYYESHTSQVDNNEPYVCLFLHYQPEATTSPAGDIFVDQKLCVDMLLKNLPEEYKVYVKEHRHQFLSNRPAQTSRMKDFYDDLRKNNRVKLISTTVDSFTLMQNAKAVATITGTVGWEAVVRQKPVIVFGIIWYENFSKGVLRITDDASAKNMLQFIENYQYDEQSLLAYLASFGKNTHRACYFRGDNKEEIGQTEDESARIVADSIREQIINYQ